jgi:general stress protein 26
MNKDADSHDKTLSGSQATEKIRELAKSARVCMFGTSPARLPLEVRPMAVQDVDESGLWFLSGRSSVKNLHIARDPHVQLFFANPGDSEYLSLWGTATISDARALRERHWTPMAKTWFPSGVDDPELTVIHVRPETGHYWDTEHGKAVSLLKIAVGAVTGKPVSVGVQGEVHP